MSQTANVPERPLTPPKQRFYSIDEEDLISKRAQELAEKELFEFGEVADDIVFDDPEKFGIGDLMRALFRLHKALSGDDLLNAADDLRKQTEKTIAAFREDMESFYLDAAEGQLLDEGEL